MLRPKATRRDADDGRAPQSAAETRPGSLPPCVGSLGGIAAFGLAALFVWPLAKAQHESHASTPHMSAPQRMQPPQMRAAPVGTPRSSYAVPPSSYTGAPSIPSRPLGAATSGFAPPRQPGGVGYQPGARNQYAMPPARPGHLGSWLQNHQGQSFASQEKSLRNEPGFNRLPPQQQQRMINHLQRLESMPPQQRALTLGRIENMERLSPERQQAVRGSAQELSSMDATRRQQVRGAFRSLRDLPPVQRQATLNSPEYRSQYSDHERQILGNLLSVEPYTSH